MTLNIKIKNNYIIVVFVLLVLNNNYIQSQFDVKQILIKDDKVSCALFTSQHNITKVLIELINNEKKSIKAAIYLLSDKNIAQALLNAKKRNVSVEIATDYNAHDHQYSKIPILKDSNIPIYIYGTKENIPALMHNKFFIFEQNLDDRTLLWTGSYNCTVNSQAKNKENVLILEENNLINQYRQEFEIIKKHSKDTNFKKYKKNKASIYDQLSHSAKKFLKSLKIKT